MQLEPVLCTLWVGLLLYQWHTLSSLVACVLFCKLWVEKNRAVALVLKARYALVTDNLQQAHDLLFGCVDTTESRRASFPPVLLALPPLMACMGLLVPGVILSFALNCLAAARHTRLATLCAEERARADKLDAVNCEMSGSMRELVETVNDFTERFWYRDRYGTHPPRIYYALEDAKARNRGYMATIESIKGTVKRLEQEASQSKQTYTHLERKIQYLEANAVAEAAKRADSNAVKELKARVNTAEEDKRALRMSLREAELRTKEREQELAKLKLDSELQSKEHAIKLTDRELQIAELQAVVAKFRQRIEESEHQLACKDQEIRGLEAKLAQSKLETRKKMDADGMQSKLDEAEQSAIKKQHIIDHHEQLIDKLKTQAYDQKRKLQAIEPQLQAQKKTTTALKKTLTEKDATINAQQQTILKLRADLDHEIRNANEIAASWYTLRDRVKFLENYIATTPADSLLGPQLAEARREIERLRTQLARRPASDGEVKTIVDGVCGNDDAETYKNLVHLFLPDVKLQDPGARTKIKRKLSLKIHPDKILGEKAKATMNTAFQRILGLHDQYWDEVEAKRR